MTMTQSEMKELEGECHQVGCASPQTHVVYWPGKNPPPKYCRVHALKATTVLHAMGYDVVVQELEQ